MKLIVKYRICLYLFLLAFSLYSCSESETPVSDTADNHAIANYNDPDKTFSTPVTSALT